jgi:hypothetical protein
MKLNSNDFLSDLQNTLNFHGIDNECNTPDYVLAAHLVRCLEAFKETMERLRFYEDE